MDEPSENGQDKQEDFAEQLKKEVREAMNFDDDTPLEVDVTIKDQKYVLVQCSQNRCETYRNEIIQRGAAIQEGGKGPKEGQGLGNLPSMLLSWCMFHVDESGKRKPVHVNTIKTWPGPIAKKLFERARRISDLEDKPTTIEGLKKLRAEIDIKIEEMEGEEARLGKYLTGNIPGSESDSSSKSTMSPN